MKRIEERIKYFTTKSYYGTTLLKTHSLDTMGIWQIFGEDSNADFGGHHSQPDLGMVKGKLADVIEYAVDLQRFWTWGAGGDIRYINMDIPFISKETIAERKQLLAEKKELETRLKEVEGKLK